MKKEIKKLTLSKETLRNLEEKDFVFVNGGSGDSFCKPTCKEDCATRTCHC